MTPRAGTVETVLVAPPAPDSLAGWLASQGVPADARVPFDAVVWLVLLPTRPPASPAR